MRKIPAVGCCQILYYGMMNVDKLLMIITKNKLYVCLFILCQKHSFYFLVIRISLEYLMSS